MTHTSIQWNDSSFLHSFYPVYEQQQIPSVLNKSIISCKFFRIFFSSLSTLFSGFSSGLWIPRMVCMKLNLSLFIQSRYIHLPEQVKPAVLWSMALSMQRWTCSMEPPAEIFIEDSNLILKWRITILPNNLFLKGRQRKAKVKLHEYIFSAVIHIAFYSKNTDQHVLSEKNKYFLYLCIFL